MESWTVGPHFHDLSSLHTINLMYQMLTQSQEMVLLDSRVFSLGDGLLGSPVPRVLVAITLNSYSVQGNKSTTVTFSEFPSMSAGAREKSTNFILQCQNVRAKVWYVKTLYYTGCALPPFIKNIIKTTMTLHFWIRFLHFKFLSHDLIIL